MADTLETPDADSAPLSTSKHESAAVEAAGRTLVEPGGDTLVARAVTINRPPNECFAFWRDFANLPTIMDNVESVEMLDDKRSHWVVKAPGGNTVEWDATITEEIDGELLAWKSEEGADIENSGRIEFRDAGARGTVVVATILYDSPGGKLGSLIAKLFQREPKIQAQRDLRRFKQLMETGEIATGAWTRKQQLEEAA